MSLRFGTHLGVLTNPPLVHVTGGFVLLALLIGSSGTALAAPAWQYTANTNAAFSLTDNVLLDEQDAQSDFITSMTLGAHASSETPGGSVNFSYQLSYDHYIDTSELNGVRHGLMTQNTFVLANDFLFLDVNGSIGERSAGRSLRTPGTARTINGNQTMVLTSAIRPYMETTIKDRIGISGGLEYSRTDYRESDVGNGSAQRDGRSRWNGTFGARSLDRDQRLGWEVSGSASRDSTDLEQQNVDGLLRLRLRKNLRLLARAGYDATSGRSNASDIDEAFWRAGFEAEPNRDSFIRLEAGERYGEPSYDALIRYNVLNALRITASFEQQLQTDQNQFVNFLNAWEPVEYDTVFAGVRLEDPYSPYYGLELDGDIFDDLTLNETARVNLTGGIGRIKWSLSGTYRTREFAEIDGVGGPFEEETTSANLNISRSFGRRTQVGVSARYSDEESDLPFLGVGEQAIDLAREIDATSGRAFVSYLFSPTAQAHLSYTFSSRENQDGATVEENVVMLTVTKSW